MKELKKLLKNLDEKGWVSSTDIAGVLCRRTSDVSKSISRLKLPKKFKAKHFEKCIEKDARDIDRVKFKITPEGTTLLVMSSRSVTDVQWKVEQKFLEHMFNYEG